MTKQQYTRYLHFFLFWILNVTVAYAESPILLDLSYLHRVKSDALTHAITTTLQNNHPPPELIVVDFTASMIGKEMRNILPSLFLLTSSTKVQLIVKRNELSPIDAAFIL